MEETDRSYRKLTLKVKILQCSETSVTIYLSSRVKTEKTLNFNEKAFRTSNVAFQTSCFVQHGLMGLLANCGLERM
jgi:hypothetical protein